MKIALFYIKNVFACHYALFGYRETLERMGHTVIDCPFPGNQVHDIDQVRNAMPTFEQLNECDVILATYLEYLQPWFETIYGLAAWERRLKVPVIGRFDESFDRIDLGLPKRWEDLKKWAQYFFFPAVQDAERFGGTWLPYGADTTIFNPIGKGDVTITSAGTAPKKYDIAFIGSLYPTRKTYIEQLAQYIGVDVIFHCGHALVQDLGGVCEHESTELLADNYRQIKIFFCLPPMSRLIVEKVFDVMACETMVMYPMLPGAAARNLSLFKHGEHIVYYELGYMAENAKQIKFYLQNEEKREAIARAGCKLVHEKYTLVQMMEQLLAPVMSSMAK